MHNGRRQRKVTTEQKKSRRGGYRPGAGRKPMARATRNPIIGRRWFLN